MNKLFDIQKIPEDDKKTLDLISSGKTLGVFQLESGMAQGYSKKLKPDTFNEVAALIAILRPGALESGATDRLIKVKFGEEEEVYIDEDMRKYLQDTFGQMIYQEQAYFIARDYAAFTDQENDKLRKSAGKKDAKLMTEVLTNFKEKAMKLGRLTEEQIDNLVDALRKTQRYSFAAGHSYGYSKFSYTTAYVKAHHPTEFYCSWLTFSKDKPNPKEEVYNLVHDAKLFGVDVLPPNLNKLNTDFDIEKDKVIRFGLGHIRGIGESKLGKMKKLWKDNATFRDFLTHTRSWGRGISEALIKSGAMDWTGLPRIMMLKSIYVVYGHGKTGSEKPGLKPLTDKEFKFFKEKWEAGGKLRDILKEIPYTAKRKAEGAAKAAYLTTVERDTNTNLAIWEKVYLGLPLTASIADDYEKEFFGISDAIEFHNKKKGDKLTLHVVVDKISRKKTSDKSRTPGKEFAYLDVSDSTAAISGVTIWPERWEDVKDDVQPDCVIDISGKKDEYRGKEQFIVDSIKVIG